MFKNPKTNHQNQKSKGDEYRLSIPPMFDDFFTRDLLHPTFGNTGVSTPAVNIIETADDFRMEMVAPGMRKEDFKVTLHDNTLTVSYEHADNREGERKDWNYTLHEYNYHSFERSFTLPETVDVDKIQAKYQDGILNLTIPKREEARKKPSVQIKIS
jgi:HSP20 family protein